MRIERLVHSSPLELTFTKDFHQLLRGKFEPRAEGTITYDAHRLVKDWTNYSLGDPAQPITAFLQFSADGPVSQIVLQSWSGNLKFAPTTVTGEGPMLKGTFSVPDDAQWLQIWFSYRNPAGQILYDSNYGKNYWFRFLSQDVRLIDASITRNLGAPLSSLQCQIEAAPSVERVAIRYRSVTLPNVTDEKTVELQSAGPVPETALVTWEVNEVPVAPDSVIAFDIVYYIDGIRYKDDNQGRYYLVSSPPIAQQAP